MDAMRTRLLDAAFDLYGAMQHTAGDLATHAACSQVIARDPDASGDLNPSESQADQIAQLSQRLGAFAADFRAVNRSLAELLAEDASRLRQHAVTLAGMAGARQAFGNGWGAIFDEPIANLRDAARIALGTYGNRQGTTLKAGDATVAAVKAAAVAGAQAEIDGRAQEIVLEGARLVRQSDSPAS